MNAPSSAQQLLASARPRSASWVATNVSRGQWAVHACLPVVGVKHGALAPGFQPYKGAIRPDLVPILSYHPAGRSRNEQRTGQEDRRSKFYEIPDNLSGDPKRRSYRDTGGSPSGVPP